MTDYVQRYEAAHFGLTKLYDEVAAQEKDKTKIDTSAEDYNFREGVKYFVSKSVFQPQEYGAKMLDSKLAEAYRYFTGYDYLTQEEVSVTKLEKPKDGAQQNEQKILNANMGNYSKSYNAGEQTAKDLIGFTTPSDLKRAKEAILKQTPETIVGFITGYKDNDKVLGIKYGKGGILTQLRNEDIMPWDVDAVKDIMPSKEEHGYKIPPQQKLGWHIINTVFEAGIKAGLDPNSGALYHLSFYKKSSCVSARDHFASNGNYEETADINVSLDNDIYTVISQIQAKMNKE